MAEDDAARADGTFAPFLHLHCRRLVSLLGGETFLRLAILLLEKI